MLRANWGSTYVDSDHPTNWTVGPYLKLKFAGDVILELGRTANGLEWLSYDAPRAIMQCWQGDEALIDSMLSGAMFPLLSSGAGMGKIGKALTDVWRRSCSIILSVVIRLFNVWWSAARQRL